MPLTENSKLKIVIELDGPEQIETLPSVLDALKERLEQFEMYDGIRKTMAVHQTSWPVFGCGGDVGVITIYGDLAVDEDGFTQFKPGEAHG